MTGTFSRRLRSELGQRGEDHPGRQIIGGSEENQGIGRTPAGQAVLTEVIVVSCFRGRLHDATLRWTGPSTPPPSRRPKDAGKTGAKGFPRRARETFSGLWDTLHRTDS